MSKIGDYKVGKKAIDGLAAKLPMIAEGAPGLDINPAVTGASYTDATTGETYVCVDNTPGANVWRGQMGTTVAPWVPSVTGLKWNQETDIYTRTGDATKNTAIASRMRRCVLNADGTVNYYLDAADSTKKEDGTDAVLDGTDGNVMVQVPKFWYKYEYKDNEHHWSITDDPASGYDVHPAFVRGGGEVDYRYVGAYQASINDAGDKLESVSGKFCVAGKTRDEFRQLAAAVGDGWHQLDWYLNNALQLLALIEFGTFDMQSASAIGMGRTQLSGGSWKCGSNSATNGKSKG